MDYLQYRIFMDTKIHQDDRLVLNLIINGLPSILTHIELTMLENMVCFKPYYKWITFNTKNMKNLVMFKY